MDTKLGLSTAASPTPTQPHTSRENQKEARRAWLAYENQTVLASPVSAASETARPIPEMPIRNFLRVVFSR